jgi:hypothetical protein
MRIAYYTHSKNTHSSKVVEFEIFRNSKYIFKFQNFKSLLPHVNGVQNTWHGKNVCSLWYKKLNYKIINMFLYDLKLW